MNLIDFLINGQYVSDRKTIANTFDNYFLIINQSISQGFFPAELKIARINQLYKGDSTFSQL